MPGTLFQSWNDVPGLASTLYYQTAYGGTGLFGRFFGQIPCTSSPACSVCPAGSQRRLFRQASALRHPADDLLGSRRMGFPPGFDRSFVDRQLLRYLSIYLSVVVVLAGQCAVDKSEDRLLMPVLRDHNIVGESRRARHRNVDRTADPRQVVSCAQVGDAQLSGLPLTCAQAPFSAQRIGRVGLKVLATLSKVACLPKNSLVNQQLVLWERVVHGCG